MQKNLLNQEKKVLSNQESSPGRLEESLIKEFVERNRVINNLLKSIEHRERVISDDKEKMIKNKIKFLAVSLLPKTMMAGGIFMASLPASEKLLGIVEFLEKNGASESVVQYLNSYAAIPSNGWGFFALTFALFYDRFKDGYQGVQKSIKNHISFYEKNLASLEKSLDPEFILNELKILKKTESKKQ